MALESINGKHMEQYSKLWDQVAQLKKVMPKSTILVMTEDGEADKKIFKRFHTCFGTVKNGFGNGMYSHLKGPYEG